MSLGTKNRPVPDDDWTLPINRESMIARQSKIADFPAPFSPTRMLLLS